MKGALITAYLRQRLVSPIRMVFLALGFVFPLLSIAVAPGLGLRPLEGAGWFALILGAGMIGQDVSSGVLQLILARPLSRRDYALSRWLAVACGAGFVGILQVSMAYLILAARGATPAPEDLATALLGMASSALGVAAVLAAFSALVPGIGDLGIYFMMTFATTVAQTLGGMLSWPWMSRAGMLISESLTPSLEWHRIFGPALSWHELFAYASTVTLMLAVAILVLNRRELSYASG
jgi:hypothetical protein